MKELTVKADATVCINEVNINFDTRTMRVKGMVWPNLPCYQMGNSVFSNDFNLLIPLDEALADPILKVLYTAIGPPDNKGDDSEEHEQNKLVLSW